MIVVGLRAAWVSASATAALIAGAVLLGLAFVFTRDLEQLLLRFRDTSLELRRGKPEEALTELSGELTALGEKAALSTGPAAALEPRLKELAIEAETAAAEARAPSSYWNDPREEWWARWLTSKVRDGHFREHDLRFPRVDYRFVSVHEFNPQPRLVLFFRWSGDFAVECQATDPDGVTTATTVEARGGMGGGNFHASYPTDFPSAPEVVPGDYVFAWSRLRRPATFSFREREGNSLARDSLTVTPEMLDGEVQVHSLEVQREEGPDRPVI